MLFVMSSPGHDDRHVNFVMRRVTIELAREFGVLRQTSSSRAVTSESSPIHSPTKIGSSIAIPAGPLFIDFGSRKDGGESDGNDDKYGRQAGAERRAYRFLISDF